MITNAMVLKKTGTPFELSKLYLPKLRPHDIFLKTISTGVCHSDLHIYEGASTSFLPIVLGHEILAVVEGVGSGVTQLALGDVVIPSIVPSCGHCLHCRNGVSSLCELPISVVDGPQIDLNFRYFLDEEMTLPVGQYCFLGGFSEYLITTEKQAVKVPSVLREIPQACVLGCAVASGAGAVLNQKAFQAGCKVAIVGCGGVGASAILACKASGASTILAIDPLHSRRKWAKELGATTAIHPDEAKTLNECFDIVFEAVGTPDALKLAFSLTQVCGTCVAIGMPNFNGNCEINHWDLVTQQKTLVGSVHGSGDYATTLKRIINLWEQNLFPFEKLVTNFYKLNQINEAFEDMVSGKSLRGIITF